MNTRRTLITWSDRGTPKKASYRRPPAPHDRGPVMRLVEAPERRGAYEHAVVLTLEAGLGPAGDLVDELRAHVPSVEVRSCRLEDPSDHAAVFEASARLTAGLTGLLDIVLSAGTPQMQTVWVVLTKAGFIDARLLQVVPPAFVPKPHPHATREVRFDFEGFPEIVALRQEVARLRTQTDLGLVGRSDAMQRLRQRIERVAPTQIPLLIAGETGSGKEVVARAVHGAGPRREGPFVAENCGALSESVLESELFGHERGAFTGAERTRRGLFERADGGTLFLDEVGELTPRVQASLLRVLQEGTLRRVGGETELRVDVRIIAATHRDLRAEVRQGRFREDLYYRLAGVRLHVPPLRERIEDLPLLIDAFTEGSAPSLTGDALKALRRCRWPGNVRQLRSEVQRWSVFCDSHVRVSDLSAELFEDETPSTAEPSPNAVPFGTSLRRIEEEAVVQALREAEGNLSRAARRLAIDRTTLRRRVARFGLASLIEELRAQRRARS